MEIQLQTKCGLDAIRAAYMNRLNVSRFGYFCSTESGGPGESHPQAPTEPCVNLSIHTAPTSHTLEASRFQADSERSPVPPSYLVDHLLL